MKRLLMIAYFFPPLGGAGVQRSLQFARHLPDLGWTPTIVAADPSTRYWAKDTTLLASLPADIDVVRVAEGPLGTAAAWLRRSFPRRWRPTLDALVFIPDTRSPFIPNAVHAASRVVKQRSFDAIYSTGGPWSDHVVGWIVAQRTGLPWVADMRDPWSRNPLMLFPTALHRRAHGWLERQVHQGSRAVIANTEASATLMRGTFQKTAAKIVHIPNGFLEEDFAGLPGVANDGYVRLGYAGSSYPGRSLARFADLLLRVVDVRPDLRKRLRWRVIGQVEDPAPLRRLSEIVELVGYVPHRRALEELAGCCAVLSTDIESLVESPFVPQKLYLYLRLGRPIVHFGGRGEAARLAVEHGRALWLQPDDPDAIFKLIAWIDALGRGREVAAPLEAQVARYEWGNLTGRLARLLDDCVEARHPGSRGAMDFHGPDA